MRALFLLLAAAQVARVCSGVERQASPPLQLCVLHAPTDACRLLLEAGVSYTFSTCVLSASVGGGARELAASPTLDWSLIDGAGRMRAQWSLYPHDRAPADGELGAGCFYGAVQQESVSVPGVSSMITSTPVARSKVRILRPSLPIILPLISSFGIATLEVVRALVVGTERR